MGLVTKGEFQPWCGGSIITKLHILTAAHCVFNLNTNSAMYAAEVEVLVGEHDTSDTVANRHSVSTITNHPQFDIVKKEYDFSILTLTHPLAFSSVASPICLPSNPASDFSGQLATVTGWGNTAEKGAPASTLQEVQVEVLTNAACSQSHGSQIQE